MAKQLQGHSQGVQHYQDCEGVQQDDSGVQKDQDVQDGKDCKDSHHGQDGQHNEDDPQDSFKPIKKHEKHSGGVMTDEHQSDIGCHTEKLLQPECHWDPRSEVCVYYEVFPHIHCDFTISQKR